MGEGKILWLLHMHDVKMSIIVPWKKCWAPWNCPIVPGGLFIFCFFLFFFRGRFCNCFWGSWFYAFLFLWFFAFLLLCFPCFSAFVLLCLSTSTNYSTFSFLQSCVFAALLPAPLLLYFLSLLSLSFSCSFALFCSVCILNETLERP
jgi:hypothetical protein